MKLRLERYHSGATATLGDLFNGADFFCHTLEDVVREIQPDGTGKVWGATAIPAGTYKVIINESQRFGRRMPRLLDVPHFTGILIHKGNRSEDTHGCILVGETIAGPDLLLRSTPAFDRLFPLIQRALDAGEPVEIEIINPPAKALE